MNILVINLDKAIFSDNSASLARLKEYCELVDKMFVIVWTKGNEQPIAHKDKLFIYPTNSGCRLFYYFDSLRLAKKILRQEKIDLLFTQDPFETGLAGALVAKIYKIKLQLQIHTDVFSPYFWRESFFNKIRVMLAKFLIKKADSFRVVSQRIKGSLIKLKISAEKIFVLPIYTNLEKFTGQPPSGYLKNKYPKFNFIILMASRLSREKNIGLAIAAMSEIREKYPSAGLVIIGSGSEKGKLLKKIKDYNLENNIVMESWAKDLAPYYKSADLFLLTSNYEGWGLAVIEAMASGCPVVMTDVGCAGEIVEHQKSGLIIPVGEKFALVSAINEMLVNVKLRNEIKPKAAGALGKLPSKKEYLEQYKKSWELTIRGRQSIRRRPL